MADFHQTGLVTTLHRLNPNDQERLESDLARFSRTSPIGLVLPALYSEFERPAMRRIVTELAEVAYLRRIVVVLTRATYEQYRYARSFFGGFRVPVEFLWIDGRRVQALLDRLSEHGLDAGPDGKGRSCWLAYGYLLACGDCDVIAVHDCDILNYRRRLLDRLCYPLVHPELRFEFAKGYYARATDRLHGRVTRLFLTPLVRAMLEFAPQAGFLRFVDSFRYALAGEFAMKARLARRHRIPSDWGLEVGVLAETYRHCPAARVCQVDVADNYEHKHQELSADDPSRGLQRMTGDIARSLFHTLAEEGVRFTASQLQTLEVRYLRLAEEIIEHYRADALINGLDFDRHAERLAATGFARSLHHAADSSILPLIPNWSRVSGLVPDVFGELREAVEEDTRTVDAVCAA